MKNIQTQNTELVPCDPVYVAVDIAATKPGEEVNADLRNTSMIVIKKAANSKIPSSQIKTNVCNAILNFFDPDKLKLGTSLDFYALTKDILAVAGVGSISTVRTDTDIEVPGLSFVIWNPTYSSEDVNITTQNISLPAFKYPFLIDRDKLVNKVIVT